MKKIILFLLLASASFFFFRSESKVTKKIGTIDLPKVLQKVPMEPSFISSKTVTLKEIPGPAYNASLFKEMAGYTLLFRYDDEKGHSYIGKSTLNEAFEETATFQTIDTQSNESQDARIFEYNDERLIIFNDAPSYDRTHRIIRLCSLVGNQAIATRDLDMRLKKMEKNWSPFVYENELYFEYALNPRKILKLNDLQFINSEPSKKLSWQRRWGKMRGGTPAQRVGNEYFAFFHSTFKEKSKRWYVMGAYTFETKPPFKITKMTPYPILFEGIYDSPHNPKKRELYCLYPVGFVIEGDKLHLSCGENDSSIKIVTFDLKALMQSLKPL